MINDTTGMPRRTSGRGRGPSRHSKQRREGNGKKPGGRKHRPRPLLLLHLLQLPQCVGIRARTAAKGRRGRGGGAEADLAVRRRMHLPCQPPFLSAGRTKLLQLGRVTLLASSREATESAHSSRSERLRPQTLQESAIRTSHFVSRAYRTYQGLLLLVVDSLHTEP